MDSFIKIDGSRILNLKQYCRGYLAAHPEAEIFVGADAKEYATVLSYSNPIVFYTPGQGGHIIYRRKKLRVQQRVDLFTKLWHEVELVGEVCAYLRDEVGVPPDKINAHLDYNSKELHASSKLAKAGIGYLNGLGFNKVAIKPEAWASNSVGDALCQ